MTATCTCSYLTAIPIIKLGNTETSGLLLGLFQTSFENKYM